MFQKTCVLLGKLSRAAQGKEVAVAAVSAVAAVAAVAVGGCGGCDGCGGYGGQAENLVRSFFGLKSTKKRVSGFCDCGHCPKNIENAMCFKYIFVKKHRNHDCLKSMLIGF